MEDTLEDKRTSMSLNFDDVFTSIGTGGLHEGDQYFVEYFFCVWVNDLAVGQQVRRGNAAASPRLPHKWQDEVEGLGSTDANDAYATYARWCCDSCDGVVL